MVQTLTKPETLRRPKKISYEEFLKWDGENRCVEWVDGEVIEMSPVSNLHQDVAGFLLMLIRHFVEQFRLGKVLYDPFNMKTAPNLPGRAPDILFVASDNLDRLKESHLAGPADLVVEVISPDDPRRDRVVKFREYEAGGVREYWLIDPQKRTAEFYLLGADGRFHRADVEESGIYRSSVLVGLWIMTEWLWSESMPKTLDVLKEWKLIG